MFWATSNQSMLTSSQPFFPVPPGTEVPYGCAHYAWYLKNGWRQRLSYYWVLTGSHICHIDWHNNRWPWMTLNEGRANVNALCTYSTLKSTSSAARTISVVAELLGSHVTTSESEMKLFQLAKEFRNCFEIISATMNMLKDIHELQ